MRIISGKYKNREIAAPHGDATRPVLSRVRKAIFDTAGDLVPGARILDLFAGSGGFVIEALSRGAARAVAIDLDGNAVKAIRSNLAKCKVEEPVDIFKNDAFDAIGKLAARGAKFDLIAVAPPYWKSLQARALLALDGAGILAEGGLLFVQRDDHERIELERPLERLGLVQEKTYGNTIVEWYGLREAAEPTESSEAPAQSPS